MNATPWNQPPVVTTPPDFGNVLAVLRRERPARPTLFEFGFNVPLERRLAGKPAPGWAPDLQTQLTSVHAFRNAGYDYAMLGVPGFRFAAGEFRESATRSLNEGAVIADRASFDRYAWPDPDAADFDIIERLAPELLRGMKLILRGPCGVLENAILLVGYETLCCMIHDDAPLAFDLFDAIGSRLVRYYARGVRHPAVGAILGNDDWGFKSQTLLAPEDLRRFVFPWHKQIVAAAHAAGKPAILHSCGCLTAVMDDVAGEMRYDGKHSYEDAIQPVESTYEQYHARIAILGGIDVDFVCRATPEEVYRRSREMCVRSDTRGAYALGTGNSVPEYVPDANCFAMIRAALDLR